MTVSCSYDRSLERKENLSSLVYVLKKNFPPGNLMSLKVPGLSRAATVKKSDRKDCVLIHVQSNQCFAR